MATHHPATLNDSSHARIGQHVRALPHAIGTGFNAKHFSEEMFDGGMDPLLMVDHFVMTSPTFAPHLHAGISAVTAMFEDSQGDFLNRDTLGHNLALQAGDLYWLTAASGAAHEEKPADNARIHALQIFVNLPASQKNQPARALEVRAQNVPVLEDKGYRIRVVLGRSGETIGNEATPQEMTLLDGFLESNGCFNHSLPEGRQAWIYVLSGAVTLGLKEEKRMLGAGFALCINAGSQAALTLRADEKSHFVLMSGQPIRETFVKYGPMVMSSTEDVQRTLSDYAAGKFGRI